MSQQRDPILRKASLLTAGVFLFLFGGSAAGQTWEKVFEDDGILVESSLAPGKTLPTFRATGILQHNLYELLAVLDDVPRHLEWMVRMSASETIEKLSDFDRVIYNRFDVPWPCSDRDSVMQVLAELDRANHYVKLRFLRIQHPLRPELEGVIRIPDLRSEAVLKAIGPNQTEVSYLLDIDPGGSLPGWLVEWVVEKIPYLVLKKLQKQIVKTQGLYGDFIAKYGAPIEPVKK
ncbi:MAG: START domain-containing protein [Myxococcota bacterium]|nr:START domain-containing protein [Myxococcota bacterium]